MNQSKKPSGFALPIAILIVVVLIVAGGAGYYFYKTSIAGKYSSPEKTYSLYIKAMEEGNTDACLKCFTEESQEILKNRDMARFILETLKIDVLNIRDLQPYKEGIKVIEKTADRAVMGSDIDNTGVLVFKKEEGNWKIDLEETLEPPRQKARDARRIADIRQIQMALELYFSDHAHYPLIATPLTIGGKCLSGNGFEDECSSKSVYMFQVPSNPSPRTDGGCPDRDYIYQASEDAESYILKYCLGVGVGNISAGEHQATFLGIANP